MQINFDTASIGQNEAQGIILLLNALFPSLNSQPVNNELPIQPKSQIPAAVQPGPAPAPGPTLVKSSASPAEAPEPATRKRRTKAEMAADEAAAKAAGAAPVASPTQGIAEPSEPAPASDAAVSADELRSLLSSYITRHSMDDAIGKLKAFGCNRVTEAISLEPAKLNALAEELRG